jgi:cold-inducible RNA-binding protein
LITLFGKVLYSEPRLKCSSIPERDPAEKADHVSAAEAHIQIALSRRNRLKNIFVGNLHFNTGEDELRQLFGQYGQVDRVTIMTDRDTGRSRGFGFVEMANREEGDNAIAALNGAQVGGRTLNVNEARPKVERSGGNAGGYSRSDRGARRGGRW